MGLFDSASASPYMDPNDRSMALLMAGLATLGARGVNPLQALGQGGLLGMQSAMQNAEQRRRDELVAQETQARMLQNKQLEQQLAEAAQMRAAATANMQPGMPAMGPPTPQGEMQPPVAPSMNWQGYQNQLAGIGPSGIAAAAQIDPWVQRQAMRDAMAKAGAAMPSGAPQNAGPAQAGMPSAAPASPSGGFAQTSMGQALAARYLMEAKFMREAGLAEQADAREQMALKALPEVKTTKEGQLNGQPVLYQWTSTGEALPPIPYAAVPDVQMISAGDRTVVWNKRDNRPIATVAHGVDPSTIYTATKPTFVERTGQFVYPPQTKGGARAVDVPGLVNPQQQAQKGQLEMADRTIGVIDEIVPKINVATAGAGGALSMLVPGSPGYNMKVQLENIKANLGFEQLTALRAASPTGGALGQVSDLENKMLQASVANLDQYQSDEQLRQNLATVRLHLDNVRKLIRGEKVSVSPQGAGSRKTKGAISNGGWSATRVAE